MVIFRQAALQCYTNADGATTPISGPWEPGPTCSSTVMATKTNRHALEGRTQSVLVPIKEIEAQKKTQQAGIMANFVDKIVFDIKTLNQILVMWLV
jgi:hypothetical protein